jgi:hypothetical protein
MRYGLNKFLGYLELILYLKMTSRGLYAKSPFNSIFFSLKMDGGLYFIKVRGLFFSKNTRLKRYELISAVGSEIYAPD